MSTFSTGTVNINLSTLRNNAATWTDSSNVTLGEASDHYYGATDQLNWFYNKTFRNIKLFNTYNDIAGTSPSSFPSVRLTSPYALSSSTSYGSSITPKTISHNNYTVSIDAVTAYGWIWSGWYTAADGGGTLITSTKALTIPSGSYTTTKDWYAYHVTFGGIGGGKGQKCLDGDCNVLLANGQYKKVKDLQAGELLMSGAISDKPITGYTNDMESYMNWNDHDEIPAVEFSNSLLNSIEKVKRNKLKVINGGLLKMSLAHPVLVRKPLIDGTTAWTVRGAFNIEVGDVILGTNMQQITVESVEVLEGDFDLYDLYVIGNDTISVNDVATIVQI
jgi:hypothetical protein